MKSEKNRGPHTAREILSITEDTPVVVTPSLLGTFAKGVGKANDHDEAKRMLSERVGEAVPGGKPWIADKVPKGAREIITFEDPKEPIQYQFAKYPGGEHELALIARKQGGKVNYIR